MTETLKSLDDECKLITEDGREIILQKKNIDLNLNFGSKSFFAADQTPTPTGILRKCEEVGLFQDLQNLNPFDDTFRRAHNEIIKTGTVQIQTDKPTDDSLHTPQVYQLESTEATKKPRKRPGRKSKQMKELERKILESKLAGQKSLLPKILPNAIIKLPNAPNLLVKSQPIVNGILTANGILYPVQQIPVLNNVTTTKTTTMAKLAGKIAEKSCKRVILQRGGSSKVLITAGTVNSQTSKVNGSGQNVPHIQNVQSVQIVPGLNVLPAVKETPPTSVKVETQNQTKPPDKPTVIHDLKIRNRYSSRRSRLKRKNYLSQLKSQNDILHGINRRLIADNVKLREEVCRLKTLMLEHRKTHKTCAAFGLDDVNTKRRKSKVEETNMDMLLDASTKSSSGI